MKTILIIIFLFCLKSTSAQVNQEWVATYSGTGSGYNFPKKSAVDKYGNFIVAGNSCNTGGYDYVVLKYSSSGSLIWSQRYNGIGNNYDYVSVMVIDDSGNVYVTGASQEGISLGGINWVTIKYNPNGQMQWKRSLNWTGNNTDEPFGMNIDKERNIYVIGYGKINTVEKALVTIKYNSYGDSIWTVKYSSLPNRSNWGYSVVSDDSLNVFSSGYGAVPTGNEILTIKYDSRGNEKWIERYPTNYGDYLRPTFSEIDSQNNLIILGYSYFTNDYDFVTIKYNTSDGSLIWDIIYDGGNTDRANSLFVDNNSNILIAGYSIVNGDGDYLILKYDSTGATVFSVPINGEGNSYDEAHSITSDIEGYIYVTGASHSTSFRADYMTLKLTPLGHIIWSKIYRTPHENFAYCLNIDSSKNAFVSGEGESEGGNTGIVSIKYSKITEIYPQAIVEKKGFDLNNYPNPFNPVTQINFYVPSRGLIRLVVYDISGKEIEILLSEFKEKGKYNINFKSNNYSSGVYFYSLYSDGKLIKTNKMVLMR